jgi:hypothetical protein
MDNMNEKTKNQLGVDTIVVVPKEISMDSDRMQKVISVVEDKVLGCPMCHSGKDTLFKTEESYEKIKENIPNETKVISVNREYEVKQIN